MSIFGASLGIPADDELYTNKEKPIKYKCPRCGYSPSGKQRSIPQNNYYWGVIVTTLFEELGHEYSLGDIHEMLKHKFLTEYHVIKGKKGEAIELPISKSTTDLDTKQWEEYMSQIRTWASAELSIWLPEPNEEIRNESW